MRAILLIVTIFSISFSQEVHLKITDRSSEKIRVAVMPFVEDPSSMGDLASADSIDDIISADLDFSPFFTVLEPEFFPKIVTDEKDIMQSDWLTSGVQTIVFGTYGLAEGEACIYLKLYSVPNGKVIYKKTYCGLPENLRRIAHAASDDIVRKITGEKGIAQTKIAFISSRSGNKEIYVCDYDGYNLTKLTSHKSIILSPDWSPDGTALTFTSFLKGQPQLYIYEFAKGRARLLSGFRGLNTAASWSPDGKKIALVLSKDGNSEIYVMDVKKKKLKRLTKNFYIDTSPTWSPDGHYIAFCSDRSGTPQIYIMDSDGANVRRLTFDGDYNDQPSWSPKGDKIAFASRTRGQFDIAVIDVSGENLVYLTSLGNNEHPDWAPDGYHIVFASDRLGTYQIYEFLWDGTKIRRITNIAANNTSPSWSPRFNWGQE